MQRHASTATPRSFFSFAGLALCALVAAAGCNKGEPVGRLCDIGEDPLPGAAVVSSPSLDCVTRTCLQVPVEGQPGGSGTKGMCTAACDTNEDCTKVPESPCNSEFVCAVAVTVGPYCCEKLCVCKDYIVVPDEGPIPTPAACEADNADNACCNLDGRAGNAAYPLCK